MQQMKNILEACGSDLSHLLKVNMYVSDIALWPRVNAEYARIMGEHRPARAIIPCGPLHYGCLIEIEGTAALIADTDRSDQYA
jgi:enamine deaminase RidA (YjgF/YER057c/UK114 family)